jgi:transposase
MPKPHTYPLPRLTDAEWRAIVPTIPRPRAGPQPRHDRENCSALVYATAVDCSIESLPQGYSTNAMAIRTRLKGWRRTGVLAHILRAAAPAVDRVAADYWDHLRYLSLGPGWKPHRAKDDPELANLPRATHMR